MKGPCNGRHRDIRDLHPFARRGMPQPRTVVLRYCFACNTVLYRKGQGPVELAPKQPQGRIRTARAHRMRAQKAKVQEEVLVKVEIPRPRQRPLEAFREVE